jgi:hypothetical protein
MFRSRWGALVFVVVSAAGAATLVGGEEDEGVLLNAAAELQQQRQQQEDTLEGAVTSVGADAALPSGETVEFTSDEELIDEAEGFDPTPLEDGAPPPPEVVPKDEVVIVSRDAEIAQQ